jgi:hypothetical protein
MNKRQIVASLNKIANELDTNGLFNEANEVTEVMLKLSQSLIGNSGFGAGGNVPLGIDPSMVPTMPKPYEAQGPHQNTGKQGMEYAGYKKEYQGKNPMQYSGYKDPKATAEATETAQDWINTNSNLVGGDIQKLYSLAVQGKEQARDQQSKKKFNDAMAILKNHPKFKASTGLGNVRGYEGSEEAKAKKYPY